MTACRLACLVVAIAASVGSGLASAQSRLDEARALYAAARYEEALVALDVVEDGAVERDVRRYRALCLLALGHTDEADRELQAIVEADPYWVPSGDDVTPRMTAAVAQVRRLVLPRIIRGDFLEAKHLLLEESDAERAHAAFRRVVQLLADPVLQDATDLQDLGLVSNGFLELIEFRRSLITAPSTQTPAPVALPAEPVVEIESVDDYVPAVDPSEPAPVSPETPVAVILEVAPN